MKQISVAIFKTFFKLMQYSHHSEKFLQLTLSIHEDINAMSKSAVKDGNATMNMNTMSRDCANKEHLFVSRIDFLFDFLILLAAP